MNKKILANARFAFRADALIRWQTLNPILAKGEPSVVDGLNEVGDGLYDETERVKFGDGIHSWIDLPWWKGSKGEKGETGEKGDKGEDYILTDVDKQEIADMVKPKTITFTDGATLTIEDNTEYIAETDITNLTIVYPETTFICSLNFTLASEGDITITLPESKYIGGVPSFGNDETWELNIKNGVVVGGLIE